MSNNYYFPLAAFAGNSNSYKNFSNAEFLSLLTRSKNGDAKARNKLLMANYKLIIEIAKKVSNPNAEAEDLFSVGCIRFLEIINGYDPAKGKLSTYVWHPILQAMNESVKDYQKSLGAFLHSKNEAAEYLSWKLNRNPSDQEIACAMGISYKVYKNRLSDLAVRSYVYLDALVSDQDPDSDSMHEKLGLARNGDASTAVIESDEVNSIKLAWNELSESERNVLKFRNLASGRRLSLRAAAQFCNISKETVRTRENSAKQHFQQLLEEYGVYAA